MCMWVTSCSRNVFFHSSYLLKIWFLFQMSWSWLSAYIILISSIELIFSTWSANYNSFFFFLILSKFRLEVNEKRNDPMNENGKLADVIQLQLSIFCYCGDEWCYFSHIIHTYRFVTVQLRKFINIVPSNNKTFIPFNTA